MENTWMKLISIGAEFMNTIARSQRPNFYTILANRSKEFPFCVPANTVYLLTMTLISTKLTNWGPDEHHNQPDFCFWHQNHPAVQIEWWENIKKKHTWNVRVFLSVSRSKIFTTLSAAAARYCPIRGWNLTCAVAPCL